MTRYRAGGSRFSIIDPSGNTTLSSGLRRHGDTAPAVERALALAALIELSQGIPRR